MSGSRRRLARSAAGLAAVLVVAALVAAPRLRALAEVGAGYTAKELCSCVFVGGHDFAQCRSDLRPEMDRVRASLLEDEEGVRASVLGLAERRARHRPGFGCALY